MKALQDLTRNGSVRHNVTKATENVTKLLVSTEAINFTMTTADNAPTTGHDVTTVAPTTESAADRSPCSMKSRSRQMKRSCQGQRVTSHLTKNNLVDTDNKVMYCIMNKVASSTLKRMLSGVKGHKVDDHRYSSKKMKGNGYKSLSDFYGAERMAIIQTYRKVIVVRHPLDRLRSTYYDKFVYNHFIPNTRYTKGLRKYRVDKNDTHSHMHFDEFIKFILYDYQRELHWAAYNRLCNPCMIQYDYVIRLETFEADLDILARQVYNKTVNQLYLPKFNAGENKAAPKRKSSDMLPEYGKVGKAEWTRLMNRYGDDMEMFGYGFDRKNSKTFCESGCC